MLRKILLAGLLCCPEILIGGAAACDAPELLEELGWYRTVVMRDRQVDESFEFIRIKGAATLYVKVGVVESIIVKGLREILDKVVMSTKDGILEINAPTQSQAIEIFITLPHLKGLDHQGKGDVFVESDGTLDLSPSNIHTNGKLSIKTEAIVMEAQDSL